MSFKMKNFSILFVYLSFVIIPSANFSLHPVHGTGPSNSTCLVLHSGTTYKPLQEWYDDECHRFRCEFKDGKEEIVVSSCQKPSYPENSIHCKAINLDNKEDEYPKCCPRLKCLVVLKNDKFIQDVGQREEIFPKISLTSNQEIIDNYDDFDYQAMSVRHEGALNKAAGHGTPDFAFRSPDVLSNKDYAAIFDEDESPRLRSDDPVKELPQPPSRTYPRVQAGRPKTFLEWLLWPIRGIFSSRIEILGVSRYSLNTTVSNNDWNWIGWNTAYNSK